MKIRMAQFITTAFILSLAIGLMGVPHALAGEGSADIGPQPPYGYYANERGHAPPGYGAMGAGSGRTTRQLRSR
jgi:hypothetical protein